MFLLGLPVFVFSRKAERAILNEEKIKGGVEGDTRESSLGFALNFYDALTDKAAEVLSDPARWTDFVRATSYPYWRKAAFFRSSFRSVR